MNMLMKLTPGLTYILQKAFTSVDPKMHKKAVKSSIILRFWTNKAPCKNVGKFESWSQFHQHFTRTFFVQKCSFAKAKT